MITAVFDSNSCDCSGWGDIVTVVPGIVAAANIDSEGNIERLGTVLLNQDIHRVTGLTSVTNLVSALGQVTFSQPGYLQYKCHFANLPY